MTQKHREFGLRPNTVTRPATVPCAPCPTCGATAAVRATPDEALSCAYCRAPVVLTMTDPKSLRCPVCFAVGAYWSKVPGRDGWVVCSWCRHTWELPT